MKETERNSDSVMMYHYFEALSWRKRGALPRFLLPAWCMTLFRGALQLHFFGRNCAEALLWEREGKKSSQPTSLLSRCPLDTEFRYSVVVQTSSRRKFIWRNERRMTSVKVPKYIGWSLGWSIRIWFDEILSHWSARWASKLPEKQE